jgi:hypothetical protein
VLAPEIFGGDVALAATPVIRQDAVRNNESRARDALADHSVLTPWRANVNQMPATRASLSLLYGMVTHVR